MWMIITLHDNDFFKTLELLGQILTYIIHYYATYNNLDKLLNDYDAKLREIILDFLCSAYFLEAVMRSEYRTQELKEHIRQYFDERLEIYYLEDDVNRYFKRFISVEDVPEFNLTDLRSIDHLVGAWGNSEYLIVHCDSNECKFKII